VHRILLLNSKGGCGKTTLATNLAAGLACAGRETVLVDYDGQGSSTRWLHVRAPQAAPIRGIAAFEPSASLTRSYQLRVAPTTERVVIDTAGNIKGAELADLVSRTDSIVVPVLSSQIDIDAAARFLGVLGNIDRVKSGKVRVALVANRARTKTVIYADLQRYLERCEFRCVTTLRDSQHYIHAAEQGLGIHDLRGNTARTEKRQWLPLIEWVEDGARATADVQLTSAHTRTDSKSAVRLSVIPGWQPPAESYPQEIRETRRHR